MRNCFVPGCNIKQKSKKRNLFHPPKDKELFAKWVQALPNKRSLRQTDLVCCLHFRPEDIVTTFDHQVNGKIYQLVRDRPRLGPNAVPINAVNIINEVEEDLQIVASQRNKKHDEDIANTTLQDSTNTQNQVKLNDTAALQPEQQEQNIYITSIEQDQIIISVTGEVGDYVIEEDLHGLEEPITASQEVQDNLQQETYINDAVINTDNPNESTDNDVGTALAEHNNTIFDFLYDNINEVELPNPVWGVHRGDKRSVILFTYMDVEKMCATKILAVYSNGDVKKIISSNVMETVNLLNDIELYKKVCNLLVELDETRICKGGMNSADCEIEIKATTNGQNMQQLEYCRNCLIASSVYEYEVVVDDEMNF